MQLPRILSTFKDNDIFQVQIPSLKYLYIYKTITQTSMLCCLSFPLCSVKLIITKVPLESFYPQTSNWNELSVMVNGREHNSTQR